MIVSSTQIIKMCDAALKIKIYPDRVLYKIPWDQDIELKYTETDEFVTITSDFKNINVTIKKQLFSLFVYYIEYYICHKYLFPETWIEYFVNDEQVKNLHNLDNLSLRNINDEVKYILKKGITVHDLQIFISYGLYDEIDDVLNLIKLLGLVFYE